VGDYLELEFELGDLEFEATGKSAVVEKLFRHLLDKICSGELKIYENGEEEEEEEEEKEENEEGEESKKEEDEAKEEEKETSESSEDVELEPEPDWDSLETETPPESPVERELEDN
jgi:hypothetical protein